MNVHSKAAQPPSLRVEIARLIELHGPARIMGALLVAVAARHRAPRRIEADLSPHLRRDIGLPPVDARHDYLRHL